MIKNKPIKLPIANFQICRYEQRLLDMQNLAEI